MAEDTSQMNASPMRAPALHDTFTLIDGTKQWPLPGLARVTASLNANTDTMALPGEGEETAQVSEAAGEVKVTLIMTGDEEWRAYQHVLTRLRRGTQDGPAVFTCAHPEVRARRIKKLYFQTESLDAAYSAKDGYKVTLTFKEQVKVKAPVKPASDLSFLNGYDAFSNPPPGTNPAGVSGLSTSQQRTYLSAVSNLSGVPGVTRSGVNASKPGMCSGWTWKAWTEANGMADNKLFGGSAVDTEARFKAAGRHIPWSLAAQQSLKAGDLVFYGATKNNPFGHVGVADGNGNVLGNNYVTYAERGGLFVNGRPTGYDKQGRPVDARGTVPIGRLGNPSGIGKAAPVSNVGVVQGPAAPLPQQRPSATPLKPR